MIGYREIDLGVMQHDRSGVAAMNTFAPGAGEKGCGWAGKAATPQDVTAGFPCGGLPPAVKVCRSEPSHPCGQKGNSAESRRRGHQGHATMRDSAPC